MQTLIQKQKNLLTVAMVAALSVGGPRARAEEKQQTSKPAKAELAQLQLSVDVPPHWRPFLADDLAEAFASRVCEVFRRNGYAGKVKFLDHEQAVPATPVLALRLINWRIGHADHAGCTFAATLKNGSDEQDLGLFEQTSLNWHKRMVHWSAADALGDVADAALRELSTKLSQDRLLPGFPAAQG